jgi:asparagine synthase (glutamine-hydrolysing)
MQFNMYILTYIYSMCGIFFSNSPTCDTFCQFDKLSARGPDGSVIMRKGGNFFGFHRLSIINLSLGINQPMQKNGVTVLCNGEIYNWKELAEIYGNAESDCEVITHMYLKLDRDFNSLVKFLDGEFAIILYDSELKVTYAARDIFGIRPLYYTFENNKLELSSELRSLDGKANHILPRQVYKFSHNNIQKYQYWDYINTYTYSNRDIDGICYDLYEILWSSVRDRTFSDVPIGCLLSGGLDSSIIVSLVAKFHPNIRCFVIGTNDSPDVIAARKVAKYINVNLTVVPFELTEALQLIPDVINSLETYDITTVRASTPQWILARWIKRNTNIRVIISGEGSDELFAGYSYTKLYDDANELRMDSKRLLDELYLFDCLRTDRTMAAWGLEVRVPFLQKQLIDYVFKLNPELFLCSSIPYNGLDRHMEKMLLRIMATKYDLLPAEVIWRPKEAFSDAVGFSWKDIIEQHSAGLITKPYSHLTPISSEAQWYRNIFDYKFPNQAHILPHYWLPKKIETNDPSARVLPTYHSNLYESN